MKKLSIVMSLVFFVSACSTYQAVIDQRAGEAADSALDAVQWQYCQAATIGSIRREFNSESELQEYLAHCAKVAPTN